MNQNDSASHLDGNVLAGPLAELLSSTTAMTAECAGCHHEDAIGRGAVYGAPMGLIARCPTCSGVLLRYADTPAGKVLDVSGIVSLRLPSAQA
jgi:hypothetical protein